MILEYALHKMEKRAAKLAAGEFVPGSTWGAMEPRDFLREMVRQEMAQFSIWTTRTFASRPLKPTNGLFGGPRPA